MTNEIFIEQTKHLKELILSKVFLKNIGWIEMKEIDMLLVKPFSIYEFLMDIKKEDPKEFEDMIAFEVLGLNDKGLKVRKVFSLLEENEGK